MKKMRSKLIVIALLIITTITLCKNYYDKYISGVYDVYFFDNYNNNPDEIISIEIGSSNPYYGKGIKTVKNKKDIKKIIEILDKIKLKDGSSNIFEIAGGMGFLVSCYNKKDIMVLGIEIIGSNGNEATCMINAKSCIVVNARHINSLMEFYENIK